MEALGPISLTDLSLCLGLNQIQIDGWLSLSLFMKLTPGLVFMKGLSQVLALNLILLCWSASAGMPRDASASSWMLEVIVPDGVRSFAQIGLG